MIKQLQWFDQKAKQRWGTQRGTFCLHTTYLLDTCVFVYIYIYRERERDIIYEHIHMYVTHILESACRFLGFSFFVIPRRAFATLAALAIADAVDNIHSNDNSSDSTSNSNTNSNSSNSEQQETNNETTHARFTWHESGVSRLRLERNLGFYFYPKFTNEESGNLRVRPKPMIFYSEGVHFHRTDGQREVVLNFLDSGFLIVRNITTCMGHTACDEVIALYGLSSSCYIFIFEYMAGALPVTRLSFALSSGSWCEHRENDYCRFATQQMHDEIRGFALHWQCNYLPWSCADAYHIIVMWCSTLACGLAALLCTVSVSPSPKGGSETNIMFK